MPAKFDLYDGAYERYGSDVYQQIRLETYGEDLGQTSWVSAEESDRIPVVLELTPECRVLEIGSGSGRYALRVAEKVGWDLASVDLFELNEAFAVQAVAVLKELGIDSEKVNVNGGAVALGHAIGSSGSRVLTTLLYAMKRRDVRRGIATLCLGGGNGVALAVERV